MYSLEPNCHVYSIALLTLAVDNPGVEYVIKYFGPRHFYYYSDYFFNKVSLKGRQNIVFCVLQKVTRPFKGSGHYW